MSAPQPSARRTALVVLGVGLVVTALLTWGAQRQYSHNEQRQLNARARDAGAVLAAALPAIQAPLASAVDLASATGADAREERRLLRDAVGPHGRFVSVSLWSPAGRGALVIGARPELGGSSAARLFAQAAHRHTLAVIGLLGGRSPRLGFAYSAGGFTAYGETALPADRRLALAHDAPFSDLKYALYLGPGTTAGALLLSSESHPPLRGRRAAMVVPFGTGALDVVLSPRRPLSGTLAEDLPWLVALVGELISIAIALVLVRRAEDRRYTDRLVGRLRALGQDH
ncbi:MAG TPA: hypothetical protein VHX88_02520 [Solirubrobacteraceae bacterium]|jgi:hypothetical protein|nr:hypothetical protein [Solirubrobacteraceae bacterium]